MSLSRLGRCAALACIWTFYVFGVVPATDRGWLTGVTVGLFVSTAAVLVVPPFLAPPRMLAGEPSGNLPEGEKDTSGNLPEVKGAEAAVQRPLAEEEEDALIAGAEAEKAEALSEFECLGREVDVFPAVGHDDQPEPSLLTESEIAPEPMQDLEPVENPADVEALEGVLRRRTPEEIRRLVRFGR